MVALCPYCSNEIKKIVITKLPGQMANGAGYRFMAYSCPHAICRKIISMEMDPVIIRRDFWHALTDADPHPEHIELTPQEMINFKRG